MAFVGCVHVHASEAQGGHPRLDRLTLDQVGVARRLDPARSGEDGSYMFPTTLGIGPSLGFDSACGPFVADVPAGDGKFNAVCYVDGDRAKPLVLGEWNPADYDEFKDSVAGSKVVWRYWKVRYDKKLVSLSRYDDENYDFEVHIPDRKAPAVKKRLISRLTEGVADPHAMERCKDNPGLDDVSFRVAFTRDDGAPAQTRRLTFQRCSVSGRIGGPAMETQRSYVSPERDGLMVVTQSGSKISTVSFASLFAEGDIPRLWQADLGNFFTERLLSGEPLTVEHAVVKQGGVGHRGTVVLQAER
ncbi:MAG: hypothetical protein PHF00_12945 [Elusimicrobia bacterium]|nr:hypothetical protein [Elusimicrobiota bacterium]